MMRFWMNTCMRWITRVASMRRFCTARSSSTEGTPVLSVCQSKFAAATASCTARLMPTPPTGDMACAASPMHKRPGRNHWRSRATATVKSFASSQVRISFTRSRRRGSTRTISARSAFRPFARSLSMLPLAMTNAHCQ